MVALERRESERNRKEKSNGLGIVRDPREFGCVCEWGYIKVEKFEHGFDWILK